MSDSLEQQRAAFSLEFIKHHENDAQNRGKLHTLIQKAPIQIIQNGLGQTLAFLLADNGGNTEETRKPSGHLYDAIKDWLCTQRKIYGNGELIEELIAGDKRQYIHAQQEVLALFNWLKKFAEVWLKEGGRA